MWFIDCTNIQMTRTSGPSVYQRSAYSGHKMFHSLIYQSITTPYGLIFHIYGPDVRGRHETTLYRNSGMDQFLQLHLLVDGVRYAIYGDSAYMLRPWLQTEFPRFGATAEQKLYSKFMISVRESVEWSNNKIKESRTSQYFKRKLKGREAPIYLQYICSALLFNFKTYMGNGGQVQGRFCVAEPSLEEYLSKFN